MELFDEDKAVEYIKTKLKEDEALTKHYTTDDILEVIDIIWDYYEDNGMLDLSLALDDDQKEEDIDTSKLIEHVIKMIKKDKGTNIDVNDVPAIVKAELEYENSLEDE